MKRKSVIRLYVCEPVCECVSMVTASILDFVVGPSSTVR